MPVASTLKHTFAAYTAELPPLSPTPLPSFPFPLIPYPIPIILILSSFLWLDKTPVGLPAAVALVESGYGSFKVIGDVIVRRITHDFLLGTISETQRDICRKSQIFLSQSGFNQDFCYKYVSL